MLHLLSIDDQTTELPGQVANLRSAAQQRVKRLT